MGRPHGPWWGCLPVPICQDPLPCGCSPVYIQFCLCAHSLTSLRPQFPPLHRPCRSLTPARAQAQGSGGSSRISYQEAPGPFPVRCLQLCPPPQAPPPQFSSSRPPSRPLPHTLRLFRPLRPVPCDLCPRPFLCALTLPREPCTPCSHVSPCHAMFPLSHHASPAGPSAPPRCPLRVPGPPARAPRAPHPPRVLRPAPAELWELRAQEVAGRRGRGRRAAGRAGGRMGAGGGGRRTR